MRMSYFTLAFMLWVAHVYASISLLKYVLISSIVFHFPPYIPTHHSCTCYTLRTCFYFISRISPIIHAHYMLHSTHMLLIYLQNLTHHSCTLHVALYAHAHNLSQESHPSFMHTTCYTLRTCLKFISRIAPIIHAHHMLHSMHMLQIYLKNLIHHSCTLHVALYAHA